MKKITLTLFSTLYMFCFQTAFACPDECEKKLECFDHTVCEFEKAPKCNDKKTVICQIPENNENKLNTICIDDSAVIAHLKNHSKDYVGPCKICETKTCCKKVIVCKIHDGGIVSDSNYVFSDAGVNNDSTSENNDSSNTIVFDSSISNDVQIQQTEKPTGGINWWKSEGCNCPKGFFEVPKGFADWEKSDPKSEITGGGCDCNIGGGGDFHIAIIILFCVGFIFYISWRR